MGKVDFTGNYEDLSTDRGYQFKFYCEKCGNGYMSTFQSSKLGLAATAAEVAGGLFGGLFGRVSDTAYQIQRAVGGPAHDAALKEATEEIRPQFKQCTRCGRWVCGPICFNEKAGLCEWCAPDLDEEIAAAQAEAAKSQAFEKAWDFAASAWAEAISSSRSGAHHSQRPAWWLKQTGSQTQRPQRVHCLKMGRISSVASLRAASWAGPPTARWIW